MQVNSGPKWIKSIEMCSLRANGDVVQISEHPVTLDEANSSVTAIQDKLSQEAFDGARVRLLNSKNIPLADVEGTRGRYMQGFIKVACSTALTLWAITDLA